MTEVEMYGPLPTGADGRPTPEQLALQFLITKRSPHTRFNYGLDLGVRLRRPGPEPVNPEKSTRKPGASRAPDWLTYCRAAGLDPIGGVRQQHVALWARVMEAAGLAPATVARKLATVSSWYDWLAAAVRKNG